MATADPDWVYADVGVYNGQQQPVSDVDGIILNLATHAQSGPTNIGFCQMGGPSAGLPVGDYGSVPTAVLANFGLHPCQPAAATVPPPTSAPPVVGATGLASFAGTWQAHEQVLTITSTGTGNLKFADLIACPSCSFANAPSSTMTFVLTRVQAGKGIGSVTASSDPKAFSVGASVEIGLIPDGPGEMLSFATNGQQMLPYCNAISEAAGHCGA